MCEDYKIVMSMFSHHTCHFIQSFRTYSVRKKIKPKVQAPSSDTNEKMPTPPSLLSLPFKNIPKLDLPLLSHDSSINSMTLLDAKKFEEYPSQLNNIFQLFQQKHLLYRSVTRQLYETINNTHGIFILDGRSGVGKSAILLQLAQLFSSSNFVIYIPNAHKWINGTYAYHPDQTFARFDQPDIFKQVLNNIVSNG